MLVSINPLFINKPSRDVIRMNNNLFHADDIPMADFAALINEGFAFCAHFIRRRRAPNFKAAGFLAVDIDSGLTMEQVMAMPLYKDFCALLYTTHSHTEENHRFRLVFELDSPIKDRARMEAAYSGLITMFDGDKACKDACRMFFGSSNGKQTLQLGKTLPDSEVENLVALGKDFTERTITNGAIKTQDLKGGTKKSRIWIPRDAQITLANGSTSLLADIPLGTRVYCPIHTDKKPAAYVLASQTGVKGIRCGSSCKATFFLDNGKRKLEVAEAYDFDYDWTSAMEACAESVNHHIDAYEANGGEKLERPFVDYVNGQYLPTIATQIRWASPDNPFPLPTIIGIETQYLRDKDIACKYQKFTNDHFVGRTDTHGKALSHRETTKASYDALNTFERAAVKNWLLNEGGTFIKSPKGSGKTQMLETIVKAYKVLDADTRILVIGHRRSLINAIAARLGLTSYLNNEETSQSEFNRPTRHYAISLDSLGRMMNGSLAYDVVIIDEVEQVFSHLLSETLRQDRRSAILYLQHFLQNAKHVFLLDADMTALSVNIMTTLLTNTKGKDAFAVINTYKSPGQILNMYNHNDANVLVADMLEAIKAGKRCFLCSNSKTFIKKVTGQFKHMMPSKRFMAITSDNSETKEAQDFILNIKEEALNYDLIAASPSMSTGIDITFPDNEKHIDHVFGAFFAGVNTHFDIDQQLCRVRHPGSINVWVAPLEFNFETDANVISHELSEMQSEFKAIKEIGDDGYPVYFDKSPADELYESIYGSVTQLKRASMNHLRKNFMALRKHGGWAINEIVDDEEKSNIGKAVIKKGADLMDGVEAEAILQAPKLDATEFYHLKQKNVLTQAEQAQIDRFYLERFFHMDVNKAMLGQDVGRSLRDAVTLYDILQSDVSSLAASEAWKGQSLWMDRYNYRLKYDLLHPVLMATGLFDGKRFIHDKLVGKDDLSRFVELCVATKVGFETIFGIDTSAHIASNPIQHLKKVLGLFGLTTLPPEKKQFSGGKKLYLYGLVPQLIERLEEWHAQYCDEDAHKQWSIERDVAGFLSKQSEDVVREFRDMIARKKRDDDVDLI